MIIYALHGPMGSGKSTLAEMLVEAARRRQVNITVIPFAKPLKDLARQMGWDGKKDKKGRKLLQLLGTECGRKCISETIWTDKWKKAVENEHESDIVICDDMRFMDEMVAIKSLGLAHKVVCIKIKGRGYASWFWRVKKFFGLLHASEIPLKDYNFDRVIDNSGSIHVLHLAADALIGQA